MISASKLSQDRFKLKLLTCEAMLFSCSPRIASNTRSLLLRPRHLPARDYRAYSQNASHDVGILGGGITGLASAYFLLRQHPNASVTIYESKDVTGGWLQSKRVPVKDGTILFEGAARTLRPQSNGVLTARLVGAPITTSLVGYG